MFLSYLKRFLFLTISVISAAQCLAGSSEKIDYIKTYLPESSWIRKSHEQQQGRMWFWRDKRQTSYERLNGLFESMHKTAIYAKSDHTVSSRERGLRSVNDNETLKKVVISTIVDALKLRFDTPEQIQRLEDKVAIPVVEEEMPFLNKAMRSIWKDGAGDDLESNTTA